MVKLLIFLSVLTAVLGQEYDFMNNLVDFEDTPYQRMSFQYPNREHTLKKIMNLRSKPIKNAILVNDGYQGIKHPALLIDSEEVVTSLSNIRSTISATLTELTTKIFDGLKTALKLLKANISSMMFGATATFGLCVISSICSKLFSIHSFTKGLKKFGSMMTQQKLNMAAEFVEEALRRYESNDYDLNLTN